jgi:tetraacyldisaccharide 4'-kinase
MEYVAERAGDVHLLEYNDHHPFSSFDVGDIARHFKAFSEDRKPIILTTEKDAMRLDTHRAMLLELNLPIYILPVAVSFLDDNPAAFDEAVRAWLLNFKR